MTAPARVMPKYFTRYSILIELLLSPIAFITPISRNSSAIVKRIVNLNTTNDTISSPALTTRIIAATSIFMMYVIFIRSRSPENNIPFCSLSSDSRAAALSVSMS